MHRFGTKKTVTSPLTIKASLVSNGFRFGKRLDHFDRHRLEHHWTDQFEYEEAADRFLTSPLHPPAVECVRRDGTKVRFNSLTCEFGILRADNCISTYFYRRTNGHAYFEEQCGK